MIFQERTLIHVLPALAFLGRASGRCGQGIDAACCWYCESQARAAASASFCSTFRTRLPSLNSQNAFTPAATVTRDHWQWERLRTVLYRPSYRVQGAPNWLVVLMTCQTNIGGSGADLFVQGAQQVTTYHVSMLSSGNFTNPPAAGAEATAFRQANVTADYRLRTSSVDVQINTAGDVGVTMEWVNDNVAPTYLRWQVVFVLDEPVHIELPEAFDLRSVIDAPVVDVETLHPAQLPSGTYQALLRVEDVQAISPPMFLAMQGRDPSGNYLLGSITVL